MDRNLTQLPSELGGPIRTAESGAALTAHGPNGAGQQGR
jgi:hypothetical protein